MKWKIEATEEEKELADFIHTQICGYNHIDKCSYFYRTWEYPGNDYDFNNKVIALEKARSLIKKHGISAINKAREIMNDIRKR